MHIFYTFLKGMVDYTHKMHDYHYYYTTIVGVIVVILHYPKNFAQIRYTFMDFSLSSWHLEQTQWFKIYFSCQHAVGYIRERYFLLRFRLKEKKPS